MKRLDIVQRVLIIMAIFSVYSFVEHLPSSLVIKVFVTGLYFILVYYAGVFAEFAGSKIGNTEPGDELAQPE